MEMRNAEKLKTNLYSLVIFRNLLNDTVIQKFIQMTDSLSKEISTAVCDYSAFVAQLFKSTVNFTDYILKLVLEDENFYMRKCAVNESMDIVIEECLINELKILESISRVSSAEIKMQIAYGSFMVDWKNTDIDFVEAYHQRLKEIPLHGYGVFAKYNTFIVKETSLCPVKNPDKTCLNDLVGYEMERQEVIENTLALLEGKPAANVLLYGDNGTGKSSTVKAIANEFKEKGLRLIEMRKNQLKLIPDLLDELNANPLKFILFIDDLSFTQNDDDYAALKAILEGSVSAKAQNLVIYATSNRRHLIKEYFSDRDGDELHANDTIEEMVSLSTRFGLTVTFSKPDKKSFIEILEGLAEQYEIKMDMERLIDKAEAYAIGRGGRSPRVAKQFIEKLKAEQ